MVCNILDIRCILLNEIVGSTTLAIILGVILYFIAASKLRLGFDTTIGLSIPILLILGLVIAGFSAIYAVLTIIVGFMLAWIFNKLIGNK